MSGGSSANNSWTILTPEETVTETLKPLAEGAEHHEESLTSAAGSEGNQSATPAESTKGLPVDSHPASEDKTAELSEDTSTEQQAPAPTAITDAPVPTSLEVSATFVPSSDALSQSEGLPEGPAQFNPDPDSFSDSYTHITPSPDETPATPLSTETLVGEEVSQEEEKLAQEGTPHQLNGEGLQEEGHESDLCPRTTDIGKQADSPVESEVGDERTEKTGEEGEPEVRRRRSLLAALERIGKTEEEEEGEEEFQLPQREEDSGFSVNKCILGAVILLGLGTIFFSGVFMDLDEESDYGTRELKDTELPGKQEWLNPEVPPPPVDADNTELLNKLAIGHQQISVLQAQLQAQKEELKVAKGQAAEGAKERLQWEEVEKENTAGEAAQMAVKSTTPPSSGQPEDSTQSTAGSTERQPQKPWEDQREKRKDVKMDKKDMGERKEWKEREKSEWKEGSKKERKDGSKTELKKGKYEHDKSDIEKDKESKQKKHGGERKQQKEEDWKKEKAGRGDEGKPWKDREGKKEWIEKSERKEQKEEKNWKKASHEKVKEGKQWRGKEERKDWKVGKEHGEKHKGREQWKGEKEYKKGKDSYKESGREQWEKKDWKEKGEKKEWKKESDWKSKNGKDNSNEGKWKGERKQWEEGRNRGKERKGKDEKKQWSENEWKGKNGKDGKEWKRKDEKKERDENEWESKNGKGGKERKRKDQNEWKSNNGKEWKRKDERKERDENEWKSKDGKDGKEWKRKDERKQLEKKEGQKENNHNGEWQKERSGSQKHKDEHKFTGNHGNEEEHLWGDQRPPHTHHRPSLEQPEYWDQQRDRLKHNPKPPQNCNSLETCAQAEGLLPVPFPEFEAVLQTYLAKAEEVGVESSKTEELKKLATEFFKDGVFVHDQMSFQDFVEDLGDVLEDMVEGDDTEEEDDSAIEDEMEEFEREVLKKFSVPGAAEKKGERSKGEWRKESGRGRG